MKKIVPARRLRITPSAHVEQAIAGLRALKKLFRTLGPGPTPPTAPA